MTLSCVVALLSRASEVPRIFGPNPLHIQKLPKMYTFCFKHLPISKFSNWTNVQNGLALRSKVRSDPLPHRMCVGWLGRMEGPTEVDHHCETNRTWSQMFVEPCWTVLSKACTKSCGSGITERLRNVSVPAAHGGLDCMGTWLILKWLTFTGLPVLKPKWGYPSKAQREMWKSAPKLHVHKTAATASAVVLDHVGYIWIYYILGRLSFCTSCGVFWSSSYLLVFASILLSFDMPVEGMTRFGLYRVGYRTYKLSLDKAEGHVIGCIDMYSFACFRQFFSWTWGFGDWEDWYPPQGLIGLMSSLRNCFGSNCSDFRSECSKPCGQGSVRPLRSCVDRTGTETNGLPGHSLSVG